MMNAASRFYLSLTGSGGRIWELLAEPCTVDQLCAWLSSEYAVPAPGIRPEVVAFLGRLRQLDAIDVDLRALA